MQMRSYYVLVVSCIYKPQGRDSKPNTAIKSQKLWQKVRYTMFGENYNFKSIFFKFTIDDTSASLFVHDCFFLRAESFKTF